MVFFTALGSVNLQGNIRGLSKTCCQFIILFPHGGTSILDLSSIKYQDTQHRADASVQKKPWLTFSGDGQLIAK